MHIMRMPGICTPVPIDFNRRSEGSDADHSTDIRYWPDRTDITMSDTQQRFAQWFERIMNKLGIGHGLTRDEWEKYFPKGERGSRHNSDNRDKIERMAEMLQLGAIVTWGNVDLGAKPTAAVIK